ncbi:alpha/beta hydrolase [Svornostia abyssi]|uniref:Alpha/beta hydrolase n=1 Tax=Svornostia abyssi TaxID=2898438 RepID=A0ABY5PMD8_9ACTN|nr:alpha/beta hydrolase [Parviterribacteraceae bacterium J379]
MTDVYTRSGVVACRERGIGLPVVLLPAAGHTARDYDAIVPGLSRRYLRTIAVDWPGHGDSPAPKPGTATASGFADAAEDVVSTLAPEGAVVIGNSVGGFAAARLAIRRPDLVRALVLVDSGGFLAQTLKVRAFCALMGRPGVLRRVYPQFAAHYMRASREEDRAVLEQTVAGMRDPVRIDTVASVWKSFAAPEFDLREDVRRIAVPTLVVWGTKDPNIPVSAGRALAASLPDGRMLELDCGHVPFASAPEAFSGALQLFLAQALPEDRMQSAVATAVAPGS